MVGPSAEPFGSPTRICPREPWRVRKQFCPETFTMAEDPNAIAVGEKSIVDMQYQILLFPNKNFMSAIPEQTRQWLGAAQSQFAACRCPQAVPNRWEVPGVV